MTCVVVSAFCLIAVGNIVHVSAGENPMSRTIEVLESLSKNIEKDSQAELELLDSYNCWYKSMIAEKQARIAAAKSRLQSLTSNVADIDSGRHELTSERTDTEEEIKSLHEDIEAAKALRTREHDDFSAAEEEMRQSVAYMGSAKESLNGERANKTGVLTSVGTSTGFNFQRLISFGKRSLNAGDESFLKRTLEGDEPKSSSRTLQGILNEILQAFQDNLASARKKDRDAASSFQTLLSSKEAQLHAVQDAQVAGDGESGSRLVSLSETKREIESFTKQISEDEKIMAEAVDAHATKNLEWKDRKELRTAEVASISKAVALLRSDVSGRMMKKVSKPQEASLLAHVRGHAINVTPQSRTSVAVAKLRELSLKHSDRHLAALVLQVQQAPKGQFGKLLASMDKIVANLNLEGAEDLKTKAKCENDRRSHAATAKDNAQAVDDASAVIDRKQAAIDSKTSEIAEINDSIGNLRHQLEEAGAQRSKEQAQYQLSRSEDESASATIDKAISVLSAFYEGEGLRFAQLRSSTKRIVRSGKRLLASSPPTWSKPYRGRSDESAGVVGLLSAIKDEMLKDIALAAKEEQGSLADFNAFRSETDRMVSTLVEQRSFLNGEVGNAQGTQAQAKSVQVGNKRILDGTMDILKSITPGCDFIAVNFEKRKAHREAEIDGILKTKASLKR